MQGARYVVLGDQASEDSASFLTDEQAAAARIAGTGAIPLHYVQYHWLPMNGTTLSGINLSVHPDWSFCLNGSTPLAAGSDKSGWNYVDVNELDARTAANTYLTNLVSGGYAGFFFDLGARTFLDGSPAHDAPGAPQISNLQSSCTGNPVAARDFATSYWAVINWAKVYKGYTTMTNCCVPSALSASPVNAAPQVVGSSDWLLNEGTKLNTTFADIQSQNTEAEATQANATGRVVNFQCATTPADAIYAWGRAKLWNQPVVVNTGEGATSGSCSTSNQWGLYPELSDARLGVPIDSTFNAVAPVCGADGCLYVRRYRAGSVFVNTSSGALSITTNLGLSACVYAAKVVAGGTPQAIVGNACITSVNRSPAPHGATVLLYSTTAWPT